MKKITVSITSDLTTDQRVIRICTTLQQMDFLVNVIARSFNDSLALDKYPFAATRIKCFFRKGFMQYAEFNIRLFFKLAFTKTDYYLANDLDTLLPNYIWSKLKNKKIFYDTHEYFTGVPELKDRHIKRKIWKLIEDYIFPKLQTVYTVNNSVKEKYEAEYGNKISVVRNLPMAVAVAQIPKPTHWENKIILLMQGAGINTGRGGLELLLAMPHLPDNFYLVYIGSGTLWQTLKQKTIELKLTKRVEMLEKMPPSLLKQYTLLADIGFSLDGFNDINYLFNLPNKIFDYLQAGVPVVATGIPEVERIVKDYKCGICIYELQPQLIANAVLEITKNTNEFNKLKENCIAASKILCWENESEVLKKIYKPFL